MKIVLLNNRENFETFSDWNTAWEMTYLGNANPDPEKVISTKADVIVTDPMLTIGADIINNMPTLKLIHSQAVAFNFIDLDAAKKSGVYVCNCAGVNAEPVAEHILLLILAILKEFRYNEDMVYSDRQMEAKMACFIDVQPELRGQKAGIVGYGAIGKALAKLLKAFGCEVFYYTRSGDQNEAGVTYLPLDTLFSTCGIISLSVPVTPETTNIINAESLKLFKHGAILINSARGDLVDNNAVANALISGKLGGFGSDTLAPEPYLPDNPLISRLPPEIRRRVALAPHIAGITKGCFIRSFDNVKKNIEAVERGGRPDCIVNGL